MPFIRGRYHINPTMGAALEAAREAEAARLAQEHDSRDGHDGASREAHDEANDQADGFASPHPSDHGASGPIHRVEIEAAEMVPSHSGRAARGFVARVHRQAPAGARHEPPRGPATPPETHVFADHRDLVNFLHDELARDSARR